MTLATLHVLENNDDRRVSRRMLPQRDSQRRALIEDCIAVFRGLGFTVRRTGLRSYVIEREVTTSQLVATAEAVARRLASHDDTAQKAGAR